MWQWEMRNVLVRCIAEHKGDRTAAFRALGMSGHGFYNLIKRLAITEEDLPQLPTTYGNRAPLKATNIINPVHG